MGIRSGSLSQCRLTSASSGGREASFLSLLEECYEPRLMQGARRHCDCTGVFIEASLILLQVLWFEANSIHRALLYPLSSTSVSRGSSSAAKSKRDGSRTCKPRAAASNPRRRLRACRHNRQYDRRGHSQHAGLDRSAVA